MSRQKTDTDLMKLVQSLPDSFRSKIKSFFQRSSELLRHFYGLLTLYEDFTDNEKQKMDRIVEGIKTLYREMEDLTTPLLPIYRIYMIMLLSNGSLGL